MTDLDATRRAREVLTPSALNARARDLLEGAFPLVWVEGELSNVSRPASGHLYFTLKDAAAQVRAAMFKPRSTYLRFRPAEGMHVLVRARVSLYEPRGDYQLIVEHMEEAGEGALRRAFEALKARLAAEGLFDAARKRALPRFARRIGVITSPSGAAVRDVLSVIRRRFPLVEVDVLPVPVQGKEAPPAIAAMLRRAGASGRYDVLLLTRGGGSLEDLWAFNDEDVARAIRACPVPVVSAVGHEIDYTIADFVADLRAPTPSAAAELLVPDRAALAHQLAQRRDRLALLMRRRLEALAQGLDRRLARLGTQRPQARLALGRERLAALLARLRHAERDAVDARAAALARLHARLGLQHPQARLRAHAAQLQALRQRLQTAIARGLERRARYLAELARTLHAISPLATLERGYAILFDAQGRVLRSVAAADVGDALRARLADGELHLAVRAKG
ncbi:exodeoxyribonuclease VII large subunit [Mizugakiibacter sediminis]|uniref:Exodeoxyribonuclease 7 large subunit n=1 Tax=Mizugakiibacter sediminis TaxID=1475481 RepID=A0A0K8QJT4_9GAMM|nr:exodeoxyribonuclease VII large subunit [Mizugakiibacter sediminis]GAP64732.1 exodeoxyribonuclease VII large subunit [Mizugakiibacter sediminis]